jgi:hypothetical protein
VLREGRNEHGAFCLTHPDIKKPHQHAILVHKKKCCRCGNVKSGWEEYHDAGSKDEKRPSKK